MAPVLALVEMGPGSKLRTTGTSIAHPITSTTAPASAERAPHRTATFDAV